MNRSEKEPRKTKGRGESEAADEARGAPQPIADLDFLRGLIAAVDDSGIDSLEVSRGGTRIRISKTPGGAAQAAPAAPAPQPAAAPAPLTDPTAPPIPGTPVAGSVAPPAIPDSWVEIKSPMVGTFYRSPSPEAPAYVEVGSKVTKGQTLCILEAMKLMNELEAELSGTIAEICVDNAEPVEYGQLLFRIDPT